jgi:hypothetical protein
VDRTLQVCSEVLAAKGLKPDDIHEVILVGGQSRFPLVHEKITRFFGKAPSKGVHPDEAVALGAALLAHSLGQLEGVVLIDVLPMAIGVGLPGGRFKAVLERNTALPATKSYQLSTSRDGQTELELSIFQGDSDKAAENEYLGTLRLANLPRLPRGAVRVEVTFEVSNESLLRVTAREASTGAQVTSTFSTRDTPEAVKARMTAAEPQSGTFPPAPAAQGAALARRHRHALPVREVTGVVVRHRRVDRVLHLGQAQLEQRFADVAHAGDERRGATGVARVVAQQHVVLAQHRATAGDVGDDHVGARERVDVPPRQILRALVGTVVVVDRAAARLRARDEHVRAARAQQLDGLAVHPLKDHAADAAGEEADRP